MTIDVSRNEILPYWEVWHESAYELLPGFSASVDSCVVDVGGNVGFYAIRQGLRARRGRVLTFEPSPTVFRRLQRNMEANNMSNVVSICEALSASAGTVQFVESPWSINSRVVPQRSPETIDVPCTTLDDALRRFGVDRVDILKIDTEGHEREVLLGAVNSLSRVARIVIEVHKDETRSLNEILEPFGFQVVAQPGDLIYYEKRALCNGIVRRPSAF